MLPVAITLPRDRAGVSSICRTLEDDLESVREMREELGWDWSDRPLESFSNCISILRSRTPRASWRRLEGEERRGEERRDDGWTEGLMVAGREGGKGRQGGRQRVRIGKHAGR